MAILSRTARNLTYLEVNDALNGTGSFWGDAHDGKTALDNGDTLILPSGAQTWLSGQFLLVTKDITVIGNNGAEGMDKEHATPNATLCTIITCGDTIFIRGTYQGTNNISRISSLVLEMTAAPANGRYLIDVRGRAYKRRVGSDILGGARVDHVRFRLASPALIDAGVIQWGGPDAGVAAGDWVNGSVDNNFWDMGDVSGSESNNFGSTGSPQGSGSNSAQGQYQWEQDYTYGGGDDTELNVTYVEDNVFHRKGHDFGTLCGGGRFIFRHNTSHGSLNTHGIDGGNMGPASSEYYNNWWQDVDISCCNARGGANVYHNNRFTTTVGDLAGQTYRDNSANSQTIGPATGRNWLDENWRGVQSFSDSGSSVSFTPVSTPADSRMGSIYAQGTNAIVSGSGPVRQYTLTSLGSGIGNKPPNTNVWKNFILVSNDQGTNGANGDQGKLGVTGGQPQAIIEGSSRISDDSISVTISKGANAWITQSGSGSPVNIASWEIRRVKSFFCNPGSGKVPIRSSGIRNINTTPATETSELGGYCFPNNPVTIDGQTRNKYWCGQVGFGHYQWRNFTRTNSGSSWTLLSMPTTGVTVMGGWHNDSNGPPTYRKNDKNGMFDNSDPYPSVTNTADTRRIGAHWQAPLAGGGFYNEGMDLLNTDPVWGAAYPNPMISPPVANPHFTSAATLTVQSGQAGSLQVTTAEFAGTVIFSFNPSTPNFTGSGLTMTSGGLISGIATGVAHSYPVTIQATDGTDTKTQSFTLKVNTPPTSVSVLTPANGATFTEPGSLTLSSAATPSSISQLATIEYFQGSTSLGSVDATITPTPYSVPWTGIPAGNYSITVKATDTLGGSTTSSAVSITVSAATTLSPPTIVVSA